MIEIKLGNRAIAMIDDDTAALVSGIKWREHNYKGNRYAIANYTNKEGKRSTIKMHRLLMGLTNSSCSYLHVDHIDGDGLNNQMSNLRIATQAENMRNTKKRKNTSSIYKGVSLCRKSKKWLAQICINKKIIHLGMFNHEYMAAVAYDRAANKYFGEFAKTNAMMAYDNQ